MVPKEYIYIYIYYNSTLENMPNAVWIWSTEGQELHSLIIQMDRVTSLAWCPNGPTATLAFSSNNSKIYLWNQDGASLCQIPVGMIIII